MSTLVNPLQLSLH